MILGNKLYNTIILIILILPFVFSLDKKKIIYNDKYKRDDQYYIDECKFINKLRNKHSEYKCCNGGAKCSGNHIIEIDYIDQEYNDKSINMPEVISRMPNLEKLTLGIYTNETFLPRFYGLDNLRYLSIKGYSFIGNIPSSIGDLPKLEYLEIFNTKLNGTFPTEIGQLTNLKELHFAHNMNFDGPLPSSIGKLINLKIIDIYLNSISGSLPSSICNLTNLKTLYLWRNKFIGRIPSSIDNLVNIESIDLAENNFEDSIPLSIGNLSNLISLNIGHNNISGSIPSSIGKLYNLEYLNLSNNSLSGTIPSSIGELRKLNSLKLNNNYLEGPLPSSIGDLIKLEYLYLHNNTLNETIPSTIGKLFNLKELNLSNNNLSNIIPTREIEDLSALEYFNLRNNHKLYGKVPNITYLSNIKLYNYNETSLCYSENDVTPISSYPGISYKCTACTDNASIINGICECNENYKGIGYIKCDNVNEDNLPCISSNSNDCIDKQAGISLKSSNSYNYRVGQRDLTFIIKIRENKIVKVLGFLGNIFNNNIILKAAKILTDENSLLYDTFSIIGFKHVCFEIGNDVFDFNEYSDVYEYTEYDDELGVFKWPNAKVWNDPNNFFVYSQIDWDSLNYYQGSTSISSAELNNMIDRDRFPNEKFDLKHIFSNGKYQHYDFFRNNCHDFVQHCLNLVGHHDTSKFITFKTDPRAIVQKRIENMTDDYVIDLIKSLENKSCDPNVSSTSDFNYTTNYTNTYKDDSVTCNTLIDESALDLSDNNLNSNPDSENGKPKEENSGANNLIHFSCLSIFIILTTLINHQHFIF